jgi:hypothetical protein
MRFPTLWKRSPEWQPFCRVGSNRLQQPLVLVLVQTLGVIEPPTSLYQRSNRLDAGGMDNTDPEVTNARLPRRDAQRADHGEAGGTEPIPHCPCIGRTAFVVYVLRHSGATLAAMWKPCRPRAVVISTPTEILARSIHILMQARGCWRWDDRSSTTSIRDSFLI